MGRKIKIGYLKYRRESGFISFKVIENSFINFLGRYTEIKTFPISSDKDIEKVFKRVARFNLDYLYISTFISPQAAFLLREKLGVDIPFIVYIHTVFPWLKKFVYLIPFLRKYDRILAPSNYAKKTFSKLCSKLNVHVVPYCIDLNLIQRNLSNKLKKNIKIITFMGRLVEKKGIGVLIESLPKIIAKINNAHLNIIGPLSGAGMRNSPKSRYVKSIEKLVKQHKLTNNVTFQGVQLGLNKYKILSQSDIFLNPTLAEEETFGIVNIEALACGVPVIATDWSGANEIIENDKNGYLVEVCRNKKNTPHFDPKLLVSLIIKVLGDKNLGLRFKKRAMASAEKYDYHIVMPYLVNLLEKRKANRGIVSRWDSLKDKNPSDFSHYFNKKFLFFLLFGGEFKTHTFSSLYDKVMENNVNRNISQMKRNEGNTKRKIRKINIIEKIKRDLFYFLTSTREVI